MKGFVGQGANLRDLVGPPRNRTLLSFSIARRPPSGGSNACFSPQRTSGPEGCLSRGLGLGPSLPPIPTPIGLLKGRRGASARPSPLRGARGSIALGGGGGVDGKASLRTFSQRGFAILPPSSSRHLEKKAARQRFTWLASPSQPGRFAPPDSKTEHPPWGDARRLFSTSQPFFRSPNAVAIETKTEQPILRESA